MNQDSELPLTSLRVDGGMTVNNLLLQLQADLLGIPVGRCTVTRMNHMLYTSVRFADVYCNALCLCIETVSVYVCVYVCGIIMCTVEHVR